MNCYGLIKDNPYADDEIIENGYSLIFVDVPDMKKSEML